MAKKEQAAVHGDESSFADLFKKAFYTSVGAVFMTEEAIRLNLKELKLPQEIMKGVLKNAQKGKEDVLAIVRNELHKVIQQFDLASEMGRFLRDHDVEIKVRFTPKAKSS